MALQEMSFTLEEKVELFNRIAERYYNHNFGTMLKADMDTLIFSAYIEHCLKNGLPYDDYSLSIALGITESRVRSLKERKQLQYPYNLSNHLSAKSSICLKVEGIGRKISWCFLLQMLLPQKCVSVFSMKLFSPNYHEIVTFFDGTMNIKYKGGCVK